MRRAFLVFVLAIITFTTHAESGPPAPSEQPASAADTARSQQLFDTLRAFGDAANAGQADTEALSRGCAYAGDYGGAFARSGLAIDESNGGWWARQFNSTVNMALDGAQGAGCGLLTDGGGGAATLDVSRVHDMALNTALAEAGVALKDSGLPFTTRLELETGAQDGDVYWQALTVQPLWHDEAETNHAFTQMSWRRGERRQINAGLALRRITE